MPLTAIGDQAKVVILKHESHKLHHEFTVKAASAVSIGMPVKLDVTGTIVPMGAADEEHLCIGYALFNAAAGEYVTIVMRGYTILFAESLGALAAGPVKYASYAAGASAYYPEYVLAATNVLTAGWNLDQATAAGELIRICVKS